MATEFKVGDRVRFNGSRLPGLTPGGVYLVSRVDEGDHSPIHLDDNGHERNRGPEEYELVDSATDELIELRAFKETALARFPELRKESDEDAAKRIAADYRFAELSDGHLAVARAIDWCRANPR